LFAFTVPPPDAEAAAAEEEPEAVESVEDAEEEDFEIVEEPSFGGEVEEVEEIREVEMVALPASAKKPSVKATTSSSSSPGQNVNLPYTQGVITDMTGYKYVRLEIHLLSGMTQETIHPFVDETGRFLMIKYYLPSFCTDPNRLDEETEDAPWLANTNVATVWAQAGRAVEKAFNNERVHCIQQIKLPFACEKTFSKAFGTTSSQYVKMTEHENAVFARNQQFYYHLVIHLDALDKPVEINKNGPRFSVSRKPVTRRSEMANPFEAEPAVDDVSSAVI
jgi:hypothetical protein